MMTEETLGRWSSQWHWAERARAWDERMTAVEQEAIEEVRADQATVWDARRVFEIASLKMEFVGELEAARVRRLQSLQGWMVRSEERIGRAQEQGAVRADVVPRAAALAMWSLVDGLIRNWLFDPASFDLLEVGAQAIDAQLDGLRA